MHIGKIGLLVGYTIIGTKIGTHIEADFCKTKTLSTGQEKEDQKNEGGR